MYIYIYIYSPKKDRNVNHHCFFIDCYFSIFLWITIYIVVYGGSTIDIKKTAGDTTIGTAGAVVPVLLPGRQR